MSLTNEILNEIKHSLKKGHFQLNEKMSKHTTFGVGGAASVFIEPTCEEEISKVLKIANKHNIPFYIIGRGSNLLVSDNGLDGIVIKIADMFSCSVLQSRSIIVDAGASLAAVSKMAYRNSLTGLEFASGIPGTVGGAVAMNAGAYGNEMKDIVEWVKVMKNDGTITVMKNEEFNFSYRESILTKNTDWIVLSVKLNLQSGDKNEILQQMLDRNKKRVSSQPLDKNNCGSVFKRPEGHFAGKLIEDCGLRGFSYNGVEISQKHAGFITTSKNSTAADVLYVINLAKNKVKENFGISLEEEVKILK